MRTRRLLIYLLLLHISICLFAQSFISLDWSNPTTIYNGNDVVKSDMPGFAKGHYFSETYLPYYFESIDLGREYDQYEYEVRIEYPEFSEVSQKEAKAIIATGVQLPSYPQVETNISVASKRGILDIYFIPLIYKDNTYLKVSSFKLLIEKKESTRKLARQSASAVEGYAEHSVLSSGKWVKIRVEETGVYQITHNELRRMGFSNPAKVRLYGYGGYLLYENLSKNPIDDLQEVPLWRESSYMLFYANGTIRWERNGNTFSHTQNHYSSYGHYFLTEGNEEPKEFTLVNSLSEENAIEVTTYPDYALYEKEEYSWGLGRKLYENYDYKSGKTKSYSFNLKGITNDPGTVTVAFSANHTSSTSVVTTVNDEQLGQFSISNAGTYNYANEKAQSFSWNSGKSENVTVQLQHVAPNGVSGRLDYIRLNFIRQLALYNSFSCFRASQSGKNKFVIGSANENTVVWNVTDQTNYSQVRGTYSGGKYTVVNDTSLEEEFVVVNTKGNNFKSIHVVEEINNQDLHRLSDINMVIIVPPRSYFFQQAERLAEVHRQRDGLSVLTVTSEQIYNEFSSGTPDATAYRRFLRMLFKKGELRYLLLFGDGKSDNRMLTSDWRNYDPSDFLLCYPSENSLSETDSYILEEYFGFLGDGKGNIPANFPTEKVDIGIGRFPVRTDEQAKQVVDKVIGYIENKSAASWKNTIAFLADDEDASDPHVYIKVAEEMTKKLEKSNPEFLIKKIYWDAYKMETTATGQGYPTATEELLELFQEGMLVMNYTGHGGPNMLSHEKVLTTAHAASLNSLKMPLWITAACEVGPFDRTDGTLGEVAFFNPKGGAIALLTTTRPTYRPQNKTMNDNFMNALFQRDENGEWPTLGDAYRLAKRETAAVSSKTSYNNLHFILLGDPAMKLGYPEYKVFVDEFITTSAGVEDTIKAGGIVKVSGYVLNKNGEIAEDFNGIIHPTVLDSKENVVTNNNRKQSGGKATFESWNKTLFKGSDSIRLGRFDFEFPVPLDINYSFENGMINLYAVNSDNSIEGQGLYTDFIVGGTESGALLTDSLGPKIKLYLNTQDFISGGKVNETPYLIAELEDEDGINMSGNGIGHDLIAIINNSSNHTYVLNNYYQSVLGSYTKGTVRYSLPELPEGEHELLFRAWDVKNNSSTATLKFQVVKGLKPSLLDVTCTNSPVKDHTTFILSHDRPSAEMDIRLSVYDLSGTELWRFQQIDTTAEDYYYIDWDLTSHSGTKLRPGLYLYQASISSGESKQSTKAKKIVILAP